MRLHVKKRIVSSVNAARDVVYRCVRAGMSVSEFLPYELGIHCGSLEQAEYINNVKYAGKGEIYEIVLSPGVEYSEVIDDWEAWNSIECVHDILTRGFMIDISREEITQDYRSGILDKRSASDYIKQQVGATKLAVQYYNDVEMEEVDLILLDSSCIQSATLVVA